MKVHSLLAQQLKIGGQTIEGPLNIGGRSDVKVADIISHVLTFLIPLAALLLFVALVWGGFDFLMSGGSADKIKTGRQKIVGAIIGFVLLILSLLIVRIVSYVFGLGDGIL